MDLLLGFLEEVAGLGQRRIECIETGQLGLRGGERLLRLWHADEGARTLLDGRADAGPRLIGLGELLLRSRQLRIAAPFQRERRKGARVDVGCGVRRLLLAARGLARELFERAPAEELLQLRPALACLILGMGARGALA